jgi:copper chaperone
MSDEQQQTFAVVGMSCEHCVAAVEDEVARIDGVSGVEVDLASATVLVRGSAIDGAAVRAAIETAGYSLATGA